jgi:hypothetical protein
MRNARKKHLIVLTFCGEEMTKLYHLDNVDRPAVGLLDDQGRQLIGAWRAQRTEQ